MRSESGQSTLEFSAMLLWLAVAALFAWQVGLVAWGYVSATNAARTAARVYSRTGDTKAAETVGEHSLSGVISSGSRVSFNGDQAVVRYTIPFFIPGWASPVHARAYASMPHTG